VFCLRPFDQLGLLVRGRKVLPVPLVLPVLLPVLLVLPQVQMALPVPLGQPVQSCCTQLQLLRE
jgi:hypothetical protein